MLGFKALENSLCWSAARGRHFAAPGQGHAAGPPARPRLCDLVDAGSGGKLYGDGKEEVSCLISDSRRVVPGALFFAIEGRQTDGNLFIEEAIGRGAVAVVSMRPPGSIRQVGWLQVDDVRSALSVISRKYYQAPDAAIDVFGVTGTNGKTTVSMLLQHLLTESPNDTGLIGTVRYDLGGRTLPSYRTTPEAVDIYSMLDQMRRHQVRRAVIEISSHAIDQRRVLGLKLKAVAFMNLTRDHLDYHLDEESYFQTKARIFLGKENNQPEVAVVNLDCPYGRRLMGMIPPGPRKVGFGVHPEAEIRAENVRLEAGQSQFDLVWPEGRVEVLTGELGHYNVSNVLAAVAVAYGIGLSPERMAARVKSFAGVPGRMQRVPGVAPFSVLVDYAHTDDALRNALGMLRSITKGRLLVVFGCGGNRDREKRPLMTKAVQELADHAWATSDNPRRESIEAIFEDMRQGVSRPQAITFEPDRKRAIGHALAQARSGDCVLIAGKGHETYQEFADTVSPFDDVQVAAEWLEQRRALERRGGGDALL